MRAFTRRAHTGAELSGIRGGPVEIQRHVDSWFRGHSDDWREIYHKGDVFSVVHQYRMRLALDWSARLELAPGSRVLEVGCGAGLTSVALAQRGLLVSATDMLPSMLRVAHQHALDARVESHVGLAVVTRTGWLLQPA